MDVLTNIYIGRVNYLIDPNDGLLEIVITKIQIETGAPGVEVLAAFPFCLIPAFAPPTIIFLHLSVYRKLVFRK